MASSYSTDLKLELMVTGENAGTWGDNTNNNLNLIQQAIVGYEAIALSDGGTVTLAMTDKTISTARNMVIKFTGTLTTASTVTIPDSIEKFYIFDCSVVSGPTNLTIKTVSGTGFTLDQAKIYAAYSDGTNLNEISLDTLGGTVAAANITGTISTAQIADNAILTAKISNLNVTGAKIANSTITQSKLATDSVGSNQLIATAVTPGTYTTATVTVDADGRITSASSGTAGAPSMIETTYFRGPATGCFTANPATTKIMAYLIAGGGGGSGTRYPAPIPEGGGAGAVALYGTPITQPFVKSYTVGNRGNGGPCTYSGGTAGGATTLTDVGTVTGGTGGTANPSNTNHGVPGTASATNLLKDYTPFITTTGPGSTTGDYYPILQTWYNPGERYDTSQPNPTGANPASKADGEGGNAAPYQGTKTAGTRGGYGWMMIFEDIGP